MSAWLSGSSAGAEIARPSLAAAAIAAPAAGARPAPLDEGFDWASAAIGAGGGALILLVSVGGISYCHRHEHLGVAR